MISLDKCSGSYNVFSPKIFVPEKTKDVNVKLFNMTTNKNETKTKAKYISCDCKCKFNSTNCNSNKKWNIVTATATAKKVIAGIPAHVFVRIGSI